jgi:magnesium transporter
VSEKEVDFVIGKQFIITTKYDTIEPLHNFSKIFETDSILDKESIGEHAGFIFYYMMKKIYAHMANDLENMKDALIFAEANIFSGKEKNMVFVLSNLSRELIDLKQIGRIHKDVLESLAPVAHEFFGEDFRFYMNDIMKEYEKIHELMGNNRELLNDLRETNQALLSTKQNESMRVFTIMAFFTFPLTLVAAIFSTHAISTPIVGSSYDFLKIIGIMALVGLSMFSFFRHKKWL